jgi:hypothetical protein
MYERPPIANDTLRWPVFDLRIDRRLTKIWEYCRGFGITTPTTFRLLRPFWRGGVYCALLNGATKILSYSIFPQLRICGDRPRYGLRVDRSVLRRLNSGGLHGYREFAVRLWPNLFRGRGADGFRIYLSDLRRDAESAWTGAGVAAIRGSPSH